MQSETKYSVNTVNGVWLSIQPMATISILSLPHLFSHLQMSHHCQQYYTKKIEFWYSYFTYLLHLLYKITSGSFSHIIPTGHLKTWFI